MIGPSKLTYRKEHVIVTKTIIIAIRVLKDLNDKNVAVGVTFVLIDNFTGYDVYLLKH